MRGPRRFGGGCDDEFLFARKTTVLQLASIWNVISQCQCAKRPGRRTPGRGHPCDVQGIVAIEDQLKLWWNIPSYQARDVAENAA